MKFSLRPLWALVSFFFAVVAEIGYVLFSVLALLWPTANYLKWLLLKRVIRTRLSFGYHELAKKNARKLLKQAEQYSEDWNYGNALHYGNTFLGLIAFKEGDTHKAKEYLISSANTPGSPQLDSFGPNMSLARKLLDAGEADAVLRYLKLCSRFWDQEFSQVSKWSSAIEVGRDPSFGPNLFY